MVNYQKVINSILLVLASLNAHSLYADGDNGHSQPDTQHNYSPGINSTYPTEVYWGDTHVHTNLSFDSSYLTGNVYGPDEAYRFAKGESIIAANGMTAKLSRPLDFIVVADHAYNMGVHTGD